MPGGLSRPDTHRKRYGVTVTVPTMIGWIRQMNRYVPGAVNLILPDDGIWGEPEFASSAPMLANPLPCEAGSSKIGEVGSLG